MNKQFLSLKGITLFAILCILVGCTPVENYLKPIVETSEATLITESTIETGGLISSDEGSPVTTRGICWSLQPNPTIKDNTTKDAAGTGRFSTKLTGLTPGTTYFLRAYATNKGGTAYGLQVTCTTKTLTLTTVPAYFVMATSAMTGGSVVSDGDSLVILARGVCWNTFPNPTIADSTTINGIGKGTFNSILTGLKAQTTYFVRSYVTNSVGTIYGNEITFTTQDGIVDLSTSGASSIRTTTATLSGSITDDGGSPITSRGICWSTTSNPTIQNSTVTNGSSIGNYTCYITGLNVNTTYYCRAFATNEVGTFYGNETTFSTTNGVVNLTTIDASSLTNNSFSTGGTIQSDGGSTITDQGVCWSTNQNPTISDSKKSNGFGTSSYATSISGLLPKTTYFVRAYATNAVGTSYGNQISVTTLETDPTKVVDIDGNEYATVKIGNQLWMASNLKTTHYRNGDPIANVTNYTTWQSLSSGAWVDFDNSTTNGSTYGHLYNGYAVSDSRNIAPEGWHVPTDAEWDELVTFLGGASVAGGKMKETGNNHWYNPNTGATNEVGFNALPAGFTNSQGWNLYTYTYFWSSTEYNATQAYYRSLHNSEAAISRTYNTKNYGFSIRCIKN